MQTHQIDALLVCGPGTNNPAMVYLTGGCHISHGYLIQKRGHPPVLFHHDMERDEAVKTGLATVNLANYGTQQLRLDADGDPLKFELALLQRMFAEVGLNAGRVALYGLTDTGAAFSLFSALQQSLPGIKLVGEQGRTVLSQAMATKDLVEIERIRQMGLTTTRVVANVADFLTSQCVTNEVLIGPGGNPVTIGDVKQRIRLMLAEAEAENGADTIFAIGYDSAVPHSTGGSDDWLRLGQTIIFDIFPREAGGGFHYDFTRTWCLSYAPDEVISLYDDVYLVYRTIVEELASGAPTRRYMERACQLFEQRGHPTVRTIPQTQEGFVHGLGHSLGLEIHEPLGFSLYSSPEDVLTPGVVMTVEPGLYYPERRMGVRLEDTFWLRPDGVFENLAAYPLDLVLPVS